ncbi:MAG: hypothetical protein SCALA702_11030 [Melioribacteraceae bacterium]|nr:MAG: hypothetical protein SCALA702_11030 [Melioribacteraceae bacterium]
MNKLTENKCSCGFDESNKKWVMPVCEYSGIGWLLYFIGISAKPVKVKFKCQKCGDEFGETTDEETLKRYVGR